MNNNVSHMTRSIYNSVLGMLAYIVSTFVSLFARIVFARCLGEEILGLNSLYSSVISVLEIAELGVGTAIVVFLYEPMKSANHNRIKSIMAFYKKVYLTFVFLLSIFGFVLDLTFVPLMVKTDDVSRLWVQIYFALYLAGTVSSYIGVSYKSIFYADQKTGFVSVVSAAQKSIAALFQIWVLMRYKSFLFYLIIKILGNLSENVFCKFWAVKKNPYLKEKNITALKKEEKQEIFNVVKPVFITRLASKLLGQSDTIIINQFINLVTVGIYTNYATIFSCCVGLFNPVGSALTTSFGHLAIDIDSNGRYKAFEKSYPSFCLVATMICAFFLSFIQDFIRLTFGEKYLLSNSTGLLMAIYLYFQLYQTIFYSYQNALGKQDLDQKQAIYQVILNIILSVALAKLGLGLNGIIIGSIISIIIFGVCYKGAVIYRKIFGQSLRKYVKDIVKRIIIDSIIMTIIYFFTVHTAVYNFIEFILKAFIMLLIESLIIVAVYSTNRNVRSVIINTMRRMKK